jgi:hypothetical protein
MKQLKLLASLFVVAAMLFLSSCNSTEDKKTDATTDSSGVKKDTLVTPPPAPTGPMMIMAITHKVANYAQWKPAYDAHDSDRLASGLHNYVIGRGLDDTNTVMVVLKMDDVTKAKALGDSPGMKDRMKKGGVTGPVSFDYVEAVQNDATPINEPVRLLMKHKVKDWDTWKKVFDSHKQTRTDAGLTDRVVGHVVGDNNSVCIVFAVADVAKAKAFMNSKDLKDKMAEAGVTGKPTAFFYTIAEKY